MSVVIETNGAQVMPRSGDQRANISEWQAHCAADGDERTKHKSYASLARSLFVLATPAKY